MILSEIIEEIRRQPKLILADDYEISVSDFLTDKRVFRDGVETEQAASRQTMLRLRLLHRRQPQDQFNAHISSPSAAARSEWSGCEDAARSL